MDPMSVVRILWRHKFVAVPFVLLTIALFIGALFFGPRAYQATSSFAMITPSLPSPLEIENNPQLAIATDNPYLRSTDPTLVLQVGKTRLSSEEALESLRSDGLSTDFVVGSGLSTSAQILTITSNAPDPVVAVQSATRLGEILDEQIRQVQLVNGASDRYLITVQTINQATGAAERVSSRLRNAAVAGIGGIVLLIAAVAVARGIDERRNGRSSGTSAFEPPVSLAKNQPTTSQQVSPQQLSPQHPPMPPQRVGPPQRPLPPQRPVAPRTVPARVAPARPASTAPVRRMGSTPPPPVNAPHPKTGPQQMKSTTRSTSSDLDSLSNNESGQVSQTPRGK